MRKYDRILLCPDSNASSLRRVSLPKQCGATFGYHVWTMFDSGQTAQLRVTFEQSPAKSSTPESQTASVRLIVCALQQDSLAQVKPYVGTTTATPRPGFPPHASLRSADVPLSARNFHSQRQLAAHKHGGAGTAFSPPGTALTMLFSIGTGTGKPSSGVSL